MMDQTDDHLYKLSYDDGSVLARLPAEAEHSSGVTEGGGYLWVASTFTCKLVKMDYEGNTVALYDTPGKGVVAYGDPNYTRVTGAHGMEWVDDENMWVAVPPAQRVYLMDPRSMTVKRSIPSPGVRPHGLFVEGATCGWPTPERERSTSSTPRTARCWTRSTSQTLRFTA